MYINNYNFIPDNYAYASFNNATCGDVANSDLMNMLSEELKAFNTAELKLEQMNDNCVANVYVGSFANCRTVQDKVADKYKAKFNQELFSEHDMGGKLFYSTPDEKFSIKCIDTTYFR